MSKDFENLSYEQIQKIANEEIDKKHKLILSSSGNWIVEDEDDYITYGDISHSVNRLSSIKDLERFFDDTNFDESESNYCVDEGNYYGLDEETKADLIEQAKQYDSEFYLAIRDNYDNPYEFKICKNIDEGLAFVSKERFVKLIDDKDEIIEKYASEYLEAGYMKNGKYSDQRTVYKNYFDLDDLVKEYEISPLEELSKNLDEFNETSKKIVKNNCNLAH